MFENQIAVWYGCALGSHVKLEFSLGSILVLILTTLTDLTNISRWAVPAFLRPH